MNSNTRSCKRSDVESCEPLILLSASATESGDVLNDLYEGNLIDGLGGDDVLIAMIGDASLNGGAGDDSLISIRGCNAMDGGAGTDTAVYYGDRNEFVVEAGDDGAAVVRTARRTDSLLNIEYIQFDDGIYAIGDLIPSTEQQYRSVDGTGNNLQDFELGSTDENLLRLTTAEYGDGMSTPAEDGRPSAREVSNEISAQQTSMPNQDGLTDMVWLWGQFIDHDVSISDVGHPLEAFDIDVPAGDHLFDPDYSGDDEIDFNRSIYDPSTGDSVDNPRQQINQITAFIDGGMVYGSDSVRAAELRSYSGGQLKLTDDRLLISNEAGLPNASAGANENLFLAGDVRANENVALTSMHTLWAREHNRIAAELAAGDSSLNDEQLYQQARELVVAEIQAVTYNEFLPALLGAEAIPDYAGYDSSVDPSIATEFSTAAYRFGHSMLPDELKRLDNEGNRIADGNLDLKNAFFAPEEVLENGIDSLLIGAASQLASEVDTMVVDGVRNFLFGEPGQGGFDLVALNIQRGRDHGLPDFAQVTAELGLSEIDEFSDITSNVGLQQRLEDVYGSVDKIDLWVGGLAEDHVAGSQLGATFHAIVADQFTRLRDGDRFWYQNIFSGAELQQIESTTLADVIRRNTTASNLQDDVFHLATS
ncbi:MAG: peroxidase family protein [Fuerstiella sp.]